VAIYSLGGKLIQVVEIPLLSFKMSTMPNMSAFYNKEYRYNVIYVMKKMIGMLTIPLVFIAIFCVIFADPIIAVLGGARYLKTEAPNLFRIFMTMSIFYPADRFSALALDVINKPQINFYKILVMLSINLIADYVGVSLVKSIYSIALTNILPILAAIIISYVPLNKYYKFNFWSIYSVGYHELKVLIRKFYGNMTGKKQEEENITAEN
jgi:O-antigen/teichoic acid export membrane protein